MIKLGKKIKLSVGPLGTLVCRQWACDTLDSTRCQFVDLLQKCLQIIHFPFDLAPASCVPITGSVPSNYFSQASIQGGLQDVLPWDSPESDLIVTTPRRHHSSYHASYYVSHSQKQRIPSHCSYFSHNITCIEKWNQVGLPSFLLVGKFYDRHMPSNVFDCIKLALVLWIEIENALYRK